MSRKKVAKEDRVLLLRTCGQNGEAHGGFVWPLTVGAEVVAPDWNADPSIVCGCGLHGLLWGVGDGGLLDWSTGAKWLVVSALATDVVPSRGGGKHRFRACRVEFIGSDGYQCAEYMQAHGAPVAGVCGTATAGYRGTATAGAYGTATAGDSVTAR